MNCHRDHDELMTNAQRMMASNLRGLWGTHEQYLDDERQIGDGVYFYIQPGLSVDGELEQERC